MLLEAEDLRVDVSGVPVVDGLSLSLPGPRGIVAGAPRALARALAGLAPIARGSLRVGEELPDRGVALVPSDLRVPARWQVAEYVAWNARLAGASASEAKERTDAALACLELGGAARSRLDRAPEAVRRGAAVAAAIVTSPRVVVLEEPAAGLPEDVAAMFLFLVVEALGETPWIACTSRLAYGSPLARAATTALVVSGSRVVAEGAPAALAQAARRYQARVAAARGAAGDVESCLAELGARLADHGARLSPRGAAHVTIELGETLTTADLFRLALDARCVFLELAPDAPVLAPPSP